MSDINGLVTALASNDMVKAGESFNTIMSNKINSALDDAKIQMAQTMMGAENSEESIADYDQNEEQIDDDEL